MRKLLITLFAAGTLVLATSAHADSRYHGGWGGHGHGHGSWYGHSSFGVHIGVPLIWPRPAYYGVAPYAYRYPYAYPVTQVVVERAPQVYVQREVAQTAPAQSTDSYWYYCPDTRTYYPYVKTCPSPWLQVVPQTSPQGTP